MKLANMDGIEPSGNGPASYISNEQEDTLWSKGVLGNDNPKQLMNTLFFYAGKLFGLRGGKEQRELEWGKQIKLMYTEQGEILVYKSLYAKNFTGGLKQKDIHPKEVKVFPNNDNEKRCFVKLYKQYARLRPQSKKSSAFYLKPKIKYTTDCWYDDVPVGHNSLDVMVKNICEEGGLSGGNFVNHSLKKTAATSLKNCSEAQRRAITGNRSNSQSIYEIVTNDDFKETSKILYGSTFASTSAAVTSSAYSNENIVLKRKRESSVEIEAHSSKKMNIEVDGNTNKIFISFQ